jgi:hypothetical protein
VEEAGLKGCPECGFPLDFERLRRAAPVGTEMGAMSYIEIARRLFSQEMGRRGKLGCLCHFNELPPVPPEFIATIALLIGWCYVVAALVWVMSPAASVILGLAVTGYLGLWAAAHGMTRVWVRRQMYSVEGPGRTQQAAKRVMKIAATQYLPLAINLAAMVTGLGAAMTHPVGHGDSEWTRVVALAGAVLAGIAVIVHVLLWLNVSRVVRQMMISEMFHHGAGPVSRRSKVKKMFGSPAIAVMIWAFPVAAILTMATVLGHLWIE